MVPIVKPQYFLEKDKNTRHFYSYFLFPKGMSIDIIKNRFYLDSKIVE